MRATIDDAGFWRQFLSYSASAWRFEQQPTYDVGYEHEQFAAFLAGRPRPPVENSELRDWMSQVAQHASEGKTTGRVRIVDEPITDYQRWMQWMDRWNRDAGETIQYLARDDARAAGLSVDGGADWWLFDDKRLMVMHFDDEYRRVKVELLEDEPEVEQARRWRDIAIQAAQEHEASRA